MTILVIIQLNTSFGFENLQPILEETIQPLETNKSWNYDYMLLTKEWQGTVCKTFKCKDYDPMVTQETKLDFNIHGLWPSREAIKQEPQDCNPKDKLNFDSFSKSLQKELNEKWNGLFTPTKYFLGHEWSKHGTCWNSQKHKPYQPKPKAFLPLISEDEHPFASYDVPSLFYNELISSVDLEPIPADSRAQQVYFWSALKFSMKYNYYEILKDHGIIPRDDKQYPLSLIREAFAKGFGVNDFIIRCENQDPEDENSLKYIMDVRMCVDLDFEPRDCPELVMRSNNCGKDEKTKVFYPIHKKEVSGVQE